MKNHLKRYVMCILAAGLFCQFSFAQQVQTNKLDSLFQILEENNKFMGSVSVFIDGQERYAKTVGYVDIETKKKADKNSKYDMGSISKTLTAVMIFRAIEDGRLTLEQTLDKFFTTIPNADKITIAHLLQHYSGIHNFTQDLNFLNWRTEPKSRDELLSIIEKGGSDFEPGTQFAYSNSNYVILSYILEDIYKQNFATILEKEIIQPLGLQHTGFGNKIDVDKNYCYSYVYLDKWRVESQTHPLNLQGAGGITSNPYDLNLFTEALFNGKLIKESNLKQMMDVKNDIIGMGLFRFPFYDISGYGHTGGIDGFHSTFIYFPKKKTSFTIVANGLNYVENDISIAVLSGVSDMSFDLPDFTTINLTSADLDKYLGVYSTSQLPIKITITKNEDTLVAQGTGQPSFNLEATAKDKFKFELGGIVIEFKPEENSMILKQGGAVFVMKKE